MLYRDREGKIYEGGTSQDVFLRRMFSTAGGRRIMKLLSAPWISKAAGWFLDTGLSTIFIDSFIKNNKIDLKDYVPTRYRSFNDCFTRKIKKSKRPVCADPDVLVSPSDGKVMAYRLDEKSLFSIKGSEYTVESMLRNKELADTFAGGYCVIIRLSVDNYHRYSYPADGVKGENVFLPGFLVTVNPIAVEHVPIYRENSREYTVIDTDNFGKIVQMEVGALFVGRIVNNEGPGRVSKGEEKGRFEFGGSTIVLLLEKDAVELDEDLLRNTAEDMETKVLLGEKIGRKK